MDITKSEVELTTSELVDFVNTEYSLDAHWYQKGLENYHARPVAIEYIRCVDFLKDISTQHPLTNFIEIGNAWGASFHLWSTVISGKKIGVDLSPGVVYPTNFTRDHWNLRNAKWNTHFSNVHSVEGSSHDIQTVNKVADILSGELVDWLYIDGDHSYEAVSSDFVMFKHFVKPGGYIGFHDIPHTDEFGSGEFWHELKMSKKYKYYEFDAIGVIKV